MREKALVIISGFLLIFMLFWYAALNPVLRSIDKLSSDLKAAEIQIKQFGVSSAKPLAQAAQPEFNVFPREEQLSRIIEFIDSKIKWYGIDFVSLSQSSQDKLLTIDLKFTSNYFQFLAFINALPEMNTFLVISNVDASQKDDKIEIGIKLISAYL